MNGFVQINHFHEGSLDSQIFCHVRHYQIVFNVLYGKSLNVGTFTTSALGFIAFHGDMFVMDNGIALEDWRRQIVKINLVRINFVVKIHLFASIFRLCLTGIMIAHIEMMNILMTLYFLCVQQNVFAYSSLLHVKTSKVRI